MRTSSRGILVSAVFLLGLLNFGCPLTKSGDSDLRPVGPKVKADLLIYFKAGVSEDQINAFSKESLSRPDPRGRGDYLPVGVRTFLRIYPSLEGHEGIAITFFPAATKEQRENLRRSVESSPIVYKVLENIAPADVKRID